MFQPQCLRAALLLLLLLLSVSDEETRKQTLAVIRVTLFGPPATCKLLTVDWTVSMFLQEAPARSSLKGAVEPHLVRAGGEYGESQKTQEVGVWGPW